MNLQFAYSLSVVISLLAILLSLGYEWHSRDLREPTRWFQAIAMLVIAFLPIANLLYPLLVVLSFIVPGQHSQLDSISHRIRTWWKSRIFNDH